MTAVRWMMARSCTISLVLGGFRKQILPSPPSRVESALSEHSIVVAHYTVHFAAVCSLINRFVSSLYG
uniref:Putative secreted protein n=1 Tax=Anopheles triannulatus TaxID=58253 RepID=A0A2M4B404_9DIPT